MLICLSLTTSGTGTHQTKSRRKRRLLNSAHLVEKSRGEANKDDSLNPKLFDTDVEQAAGFALALARTCNSRRAGMSALVGYVLRL